MRAHHAGTAVVLLVPLVGCSLVESFDGYADGVDAAVPLDAGGETRGDGSVDLGVDARLDDGVDAPGADATSDLGPPDGDSAPPIDAPTDLVVDTFPGPGDYLCLIGGASGTASAPVAQAEVWCAHLSGGAPEAWVAQPSLPQPLFDLAVVTDGTTIWATGGSRTDGALSSVVYASRIGAGGRLGDWTAIGALDQGRKQHLALLQGSTLEIYGGAGAGTDPPPNAHATLDATSIGAWTTESTVGTTYTSARAAGVAFVNSFYVYGGVRAGADVTGPANRFVLPTGGGAFGVPYAQTSAKLPSPRAGLTSALVPAVPRALAIGGQSAGVPLADVLRARFGVGSGGEPNVLFAWETGRSLVHARYGHAGAQSGAVIFAIGGVLDGGAITGELERGTYDALADDVVTWELSSLPAPRAFAGAAVVTL